MPGKKPHLLAASVPPGRLVPALVRNMAHTAGGHVAYCVREPAGLAVVAAWPERVGPQRIPDDVVAREPVDGDGLVLIATPGAGARPSGKRCGKRPAGSGWRLGCGRRGRITTVPAPASTCCAPT